jgi:hypothetical protein
MNSIQSAATTLYVPELFRYQPTAILDCVLTHRLLRLRSLPSLRCEHTYIIMMIIIAIREDPSHSGCGRLRLM